MTERTERNKALVPAHYEATTNKFDPDAIDRQVAEDFFDHAAGARLGPEGVKAHIRGLHAAFPDLHVTIEDMVAESDRVAVRRHGAARIAASSGAFRPPIWPSNSAAWCSGASRTTGSRSAGPISTRRA